MVFDAVTSVTCQDQLQFKASPRPGISGHERLQNAQIKQMWFHVSTLICMNVTILINIAASHIM